jgi:hypothetical protein
MVEVAGGEISSEISDIYPAPVKPFVFEVNPDNVRRLIGKISLTKILLIFYRHYKYR